ncbi:tubulin--tyrosine ligase-like protein 12 isoform X1 [Papaver somniferum]|uniref:tubulin--tyrosine ligase-like protein 12 isoform X1 n=1 Tax=Papaver somniferum TaxID=3469 RepID=UPI000E6FC946|nr:tubulin--tyrosine ligase-like protein 12 isoform X1 [Papaver somniferum]
MATSKIKTLEDFIRVHAILLAASGIPSSLYPQLYQKLSTENFDGGNFFQIESCEEFDNKQRKLVFTSDYIEKESQIFLIDHAWTFRLSDARKQLLEVPGLAQRMASLMCVDLDVTSDLEEVNTESENGHGNITRRDVEEIIEREIREARDKGSNGVRWLELDELDIDDATLCSLDLSNKFPNLVALSLYGNKLQNPEIVVREITKFKHLRALWLNENPVLQRYDGQMEDTIVQEVHGLEIYNSHFTNKFSRWALGFCGGIYGKDNAGCFDETARPLESLTSLDLSNRYIRNLLIETFSPIELPSLSHLNLRGNPLDQNCVTDLLKFLKQYTTLRTLEVDIPGPLGRSAIEILECLPNLLEFNGVSASIILETGKHVIDSALQPRLPEWTRDDSLVDRVVNAMWLYLMTYRLADEEKIDETSVWYVMDELGSALRHSDKPNFRVSPFLYMPDGKLASAISFTILWPIHNVRKGDECTRDFLFGIGEDKQRSARYTAWFHTPRNFFIQEYEMYKNQLASRSSVPASPCVETSSPASLTRNDGAALRVYTDVPHVDDFLTRPEFVLTTDPADADIIWTSVQVDDETRKATGITDRQYVNQFPFEACLVMKHYLADTVQKALGSPEWLQPTYNLETHLAQLIGDYTVRKRDGNDNLWILKPWNMARTIDTTVTSNISAIIRLMETGPKICQKYIERPSLFNGRKFDLRYIVLVRQIRPLELFLSDVFWVRLANNQYSVDERTLFEYETHFTVMNYIGKLNHMNTPDFVKEFEKEHNVNWLDIHQNIRKMIRAVFESAAVVHPEMHSPMSRAMYGVDVMLDSSFKPKLLEVTYCPDCKRACTYDTEAIVGNKEIIRGKDFFNFVFGCLFLGETTHVTPL